MGISYIRGGLTCQISGTGKYLVGLFLIVRSMSILIAQLILIQRAPAGKVLIHRMRFCSASKEIVKLARFLNFILFLKLIFVQSIHQKKTLRRALTSFSFLKSKIYFLISFYARSAYGL